MLLQIETSIKSLLYYFILNLLCHNWYRSRETEIVQCEFEVTIIVSVNLLISNDYFQCRSTFAVIVYPFPYLLTADTR